MSKQRDQIGKLRVTKNLRFEKNANITAVNADGTATDIAIAELVSLNDLGATDLQKIDGITNGTAAANKALVLDADKGIATITSATITTLTSTTVNSAALTGTTTLTMTSANAAALAVGLAGATNPAFVVDSSTGSQAAGLKITGAVAAGTVAVAVISSGADANLTINAKGTGTIAIGSVSTGTVTIPNLSCTTVIFGSTTIDETDAGKIDGITNGTSAASKALVLDAAESLLWATTDATASETVTLSVADTRTGAGATGWAIKGELATNVSLGSYANGIYGILNFTGSGGGVTGLGAGVCAEIVMSAGTGAGTYAALELEIGMPTGALSGNSGTSFIYCSLYGADASTFDTSGYLFQLAGYTKAGGKFVQDTTSGATIRPVQVIKVKTLDGDRYLPLYSTAAIAA